MFLAFLNSVINHFNSCFFPKKMLMHFETYFQIMSMKAVDKSLILRKKATLYTTLKPFPWRQEKVKQGNLSQCWTLHWFIAKQSIYLFYRLLRGWIYLHISNTNVSSFFLADCQIPLFQYRNVFLGGFQPFRTFLYINKNIILYLPIRKTAELCKNENIITSGFSIVEKKKTSQRHEWLSHCYWDFSWVSMFLWLVRGKQNVWIKISSI